MRLSSLKQTSERKFTYLTSPTKFFNSMCVKITPDISHMVGNYWNVYYHFISISKIKKFLMKIDNDYLWHSIWLTNDKQWNNFCFRTTRERAKRVVKIPHSQQIDIFMMIEIFIHISYTGFDILHADCRDDSFYYDLSI